MKRKLFGAVATAGIVVSAQYAAANCDTVRMAEPGWSDLALTTGVASTILEGLGYAAESNVLGIPVIYESMVGKDLDVYLGYWDPAMETYYQAYRDTGDIETVHQNLEGAKFTFAVPKYVYDAGVTDFAHLAEHADKFGSQLYGIEPGSNEIMLDVVGSDAFGLADWKVVESSEQGMLAQVKRSVRKEDWIVFLAWAPHPMNTEFEIEYLSGGDDPNTAAARLLKAHPEYLEGWLQGVTTKDGGDGLAAVRAHLGL